MDVVEVSVNENQSDIEMEEIEPAKEKKKKHNDNTFSEDTIDIEIVDKEQNDVQNNEKSEDTDIKLIEEDLQKEKNNMTEKQLVDVEMKNAFSDVIKGKAISKIREVPPEIIIDEDDTPAENKNESKDDDDDDDDVILCEDEKRHGRCCCNMECESQESLQNAAPFVLTYYGMKYVKGKSQKVCKRCLEKSIKHQEYLTYVLMEHKPLLKAEFPVRKVIAFIDDSDEEGSDEEPPLEDDILREIDDKLMEVIDSSIENYDLDYQIKESEVILAETYHTLEDKFSETDAIFDDLQKQVDEIRNLVYKGFVPKMKEVPSEEIMDVPGSPMSEKKFRMFSPSFTSPVKRTSSSSPHESPRRPSLVGVATKKVTQVQRTVFPGLPQIEVHQQQDVVALEQVQQIRPTLPPLGQLARPRPVVNDVLYVMKHGYYGQWARARVLEVLPKDTSASGRPENLYKIKFESRKSNLVKTVTGKQIAYPSPSPVRLPVGTRVIALFRDEWSKECYYAGIIAEPPKFVNKYRYLVFFDDGYAQYVSHDKVLLVCESSRNVWDDIHPDSRDFVKGYLEQYPERPMLKLQQGQIVKTEWNGKWWIARVIEVDGSLVKMHFDADGRTELIYRGSTRLGPLYSELHNADARKKLGSFGRHRSLGISSLKRRNMPYVEYTRNDNEENKQDDSGVTITIVGPTMRGLYEDYRMMERSLPSRAVAKKSTCKRSDGNREQLEALILSSDRDLRSGHVESIYIDPPYKPRPFSPHQCGQPCIDGIVYDASQIKRYNPLVLPQLHGWQRHVIKCRGKKVVIYRTPCGRRVRTMEELHRYLRVSKSELSVDLFDFDSWVHCFSEFANGIGFINIKDLSYGCENVPVPCVNNRDHSEPEYVKYSTVRLPMEGVNVNTNPNFLVCCDCTDDCQDKEKCACWQLTIQGTAFGPGGKVDTSVGYCFKRLREPVMTGIYECNVRCKCASTCLNRVAQHPLQLRLQVFKTENRGWGIRCLNDVPHGAFICIYAGRLLTEQGANEGGKNYGDEYLAELDYIEVVERLKDGYESDVVEDDDSPLDDVKNINVGKERPPGDMSEEEEEDPETSQDAHDSDFEVYVRHNLRVLPLDESTIRTRLRNRKSRSSSDSQGREKIDTLSLEKDVKKMEIEKKPDDTSSLITLSDDEDDEQREREPSRFAAVSGPKKELEKKPTYKSVREYYGDDEYCYIMDAKNDGNIGRYLNHSCTPNVFVQNVFVDTHDLRFPWVAFFALTYISAGTELTWDYNYDVGSVPGKVLHCYCGSNECRGRLL